MPDALLLPPDNCNTPPADAVLSPLAITMRPAIPPTLDPTDRVMLPDEDDDDDDEDAVVGVPLVRIITLPLLVPPDTPLSNTMLPLMPLDDTPDDIMTSPLVDEEEPLPT